MGLSLPWNKRPQALHLEYFNPICFLFHPPACYFYVNETGQFLTSPGFPNEEYTNNLNCVYEFESPDDSQCIRIVFLEAYLDGPDDDGACTNDIITVSQKMHELIPMLALV